MAAESELSLEQARRLIARHVTTGERERVPLLDALNRRAFAAIRAPLPVPHFRQATMDGFAVKSSDLAGPGPWRLPVCGEIAAGCTDMPEQKKGQACRIMTGAALPDRADQVIPQEWCRLEERLVVVGQRGGRGDYIRPVGIDLKKGEIILGRGELIAPFHLHLLATSGLREIAVFAAPRVAHLCTGSELVGANPLPGQIISGNRALLNGLIRAAQAIPEDMGTATDAVGSIASLLARADGPRIIITTGGMGPGKYDLTEEALQRIGVRIFYRSLRVRPGRFTIFGVRGNTLFFALPGPPPAVHLLFQELVRPAIRAMQGGSIQPAKARAVLAEEVTINRTGQLNLKSAVISCRDGQLIARLAGLTEAANGVILVPPHRKRLQRGEKVSIHHYDHELRYPGAAARHKKKGEQ